MTHKHNFKLTHPNKNSIIYSNSSYVLGVGLGNAYHNLSMIEATDSGYFQLTTLGDPIFVSSNDFSLLQGSPAIGRGVNYGSNYKFGLKQNTLFGNNIQMTKVRSAIWDIGAYIFSKPRLLKISNKYQMKNGKLISIK